MHDSEIQALPDGAYGGWDTRHVRRARDDWVSAMIGDEEFDSVVWRLAEPDGERLGFAFERTVAR
jgi:hypothetical protein